MKGILRRALALGLCGTLLAGSALAAASFSDVPVNHWSYSHVTRAADEGLIAGMGDGNYGVNLQVTNAQFATMVCNLLYKNAVTSQQQSLGSSVDWWQAYLTAAYVQGILSNTAAAGMRVAEGRWTSAAANAPISRYDMAQILMNVTTDQGWTAPSALELTAARLQVGDWGSVPAGYQNAVSFAYAKGYLSGMDDGTFSGTKAVTRGEAAVVLCRLLDAKNTALTSPNYTNTTKLVNGKTATEANVENALTELKLEYPENHAWDAAKTYQSKELGVGFGSAAFAYLLSDRVFGAMDSVSHTRRADLQAGDVVYLSSSRQYVVVLEVDDDTFYYVASSDTKGTVSWRGSGWVDDLGKNDIIYTRYPGSTGTSSSSSSNTLTNGKTVTEKNVYNLLMDLQDDYPKGYDWDMDERYRSSAFGGNAYGSEAFAYFLSDEVFGDLEVSEHSKAANLKVGDVVYFYNDELFVLVLEIDGDEIVCATVSSRGRITWSDFFDIDELTNRDIIYTRYPSGSGSSSSSKTLADGSSVTTKNVTSLLSDLQDDYPRGDIWDMDDRYRSNAFGGTAYDSEAFAYFISDKVFGDLPVTEHSKPANLMVGDVVHLYNDDLFVVVVKISGDTVTCATVSSSGRITWSDYFYLDEMSSKDVIYTRYPSGTGSSSGSKTLSNGKEPTEKNAYSLLLDVQEDYYQGGTWNMSNSYKSTPFGGTFRGGAAFAFYISDYVFGTLPVEEHSSSSGIMVGDVIYFYDDDIYVVVLKIDGTDLTCGTVSSRGKITWKDTNYSTRDITRDDTVYTRYP